LQAPMKIEFRFLAVSMLGLAAVLLVLSAL
jgi:hypothetical protein